MKKWPFNCIIIIAALCASPAAQPVRDTVIVAINDTPPWKMLENGRAAGIDIDITNSLLSRLGLKAEYRMMPFSRCLHSLETGEADLMGFLTYKQERTAYLVYMQPPYQSDVKMFYVRKGEGRRLVKYDDLHSLTIGIVRGMKHFEPFDSDPKIVKESVSDNLLNYRKLVAGRIDAVLENDTQGPYQARTAGVGEMVEAAPYRFRKPGSGFFAMSKKSAFMKNFPEFEKALGRMVESGEVDRIIQDSMKKY